MRFLVEEIVYLTPTCLINGDSNEVERVDGGTKVEFVRGYYFD